MIVVSALIGTSMTELETLWQTYTSVWRTLADEERQEIYGQCLVEQFTYEDPLMKTQGWDEFGEYVAATQASVPGLRFETLVSFQLGNRLATKWQMLDGANSILAEGFGFATFSIENKLESVTNFYATPSLN